ncbi:hypothetical protein PSAC2689_120179 [Paraburkholderia sacchari]
MLPGLNLEASGRQFAQCRYRPTADGEWLLMAESTISMMRDTPDVEIVEGSFWASL